MTVQAVYELSCDARGCLTAYPAPCNTIHHPAAIRAAARRDGWTRHNAEDRCPEHPVTPAEAA